MGLLGRTREDRCRLPLDDISSWASGEAEDGAELVSGRTILLLFGDFSEVGEVVFGGHGNHAVEEAGEGWVPVENGGVFGVNVQKVELVGPLSEVLFETREEAAQDGGFKWVKEGNDGRGLG